MALSDTAIRLAKLGTTERKVADEKGLYLLLTPGRIEAVAVQVSP